MATGSGPFSGGAVGKIMDVPKGRLGGGDKVGSRAVVESEARAAVRAVGSAGNDWPWRVGDPTRTGGRAPPPTLTLEGNVEVDEGTEEEDSETALRFPEELLDSASKSCRSLAEDGFPHEERSREKESRRWRAEEEEPVGVAGSSGTTATVVTPSTISAD